MSGLAKHGSRGALVFTGGDGVHRETADGRREIADAEAAQMRGLAYDPSFSIEGFGRTGRWFGLEQRHVRPDLASLTKEIRSGYLPLSSSAISDRVCETLRDRMPADLPFMYGLTSSNHPTCCAAGLASLAVLEPEEPVENAREVGVHLSGSLRKSLSDSPIVGELRGLGMLAALETARDRDTREPFPNRGDPPWIARAALERGLVCGALFQCVALAPPLCATIEDVDSVVAVLEDVWPAAERRAREAA